VALPKVFGFEICEILRRDPSFDKTKIILIASIYDKTAYKRTPHSLYGADDYLEIHHVQNDLVGKVRSLIAGRDEPAAKPKPDAGEVVKRGIADLVEKVKKEETVPADRLAGMSLEAREHQNAKRLARIIISDIALYNEDLVIEGIRNGNFYELLEQDIKEGRELYARRVPETVQSSTRYLEDEFEQFIAFKRKELETAR
jgi:response regulator RpfG family c-di-GMP phosphodiesterase